MNQLLFYVDRKDKCDRVYYQQEASCSSLEVRHGLADDGIEFHPIDQPSPTERRTSHLDEG